MGLAVGEADGLGAEPSDSVGVIAMGMGQQYCVDAATGRRRSLDGIDVARIRGSRIDDGAASRPVEVGVRPSQGHRARIGGDQPLYLGMTRGGVGDRVSLGDLFEGRLARDLGLEPDEGAAAAQDLAYQ